MAVHSRPVDPEATLTRGSVTKPLAENCHAAKILRFVERVGAVTHNAFHRSADSRSIPIMAPVGALTHIRKRQIGGHSCYRF